MSSREPQPPTPPGPPGAPPPGKPTKRAPGSSLIPGGWFWLLIIAGALVLILLSDQLTSSDLIEYGDFKRQLQLGNVKEAKIGTSKITGTFKGTDALEQLDPPDLRKRIINHELKFSTLRPPQLNDDPKLLDELLAKGVRHGFEKESAPWLAPLLIYMLPTLIILGLFFFFLLPRMRDPMGGGFLTNYIKSPARRYEKNKGRVTFEDVADMENAKSELQEVVEFLRNPDKFQRLGGQIPKGVLLIGPPGTGKTLLARAVAGEAGVPFYSINGSEFIQMFVGVGASRVRDLFKTARDNAPCILFIDEIDAVGRVRGAGLGGGHDEREQTLNQILSEMDGFLPSESVIVVAATNRPDVLDPALLRPGRFDRHVTIDRPTWRGRLAILKVHTRDKPLDANVNLEAIARAMIGMTGADLRNLANEAALLATREGKSRIDRSDFDRAADRVLIGAKREEVLTPEQKRRTAYHEAGHALAAWSEPAADPIFKLTIVPRGQSLGMTRLLPEEDRVDHTRAQLQARLVVAMGGRAADRLVYNEATSGAAQDLKDATRIARLMVTQFGMSDRLGPVAYRTNEEHIFLGKELNEPRDFSEGTALLIDEEVRRMLQDADERALQHLVTNREKLDRLVEALLQREELSSEEVEQIIQGGRLPEPATTNGETMTVLPADN
jgi:cell division protease FtsH